MLKTVEKISIEGAGNIELIFHKLRDSIFYFIDKFVFIEDRDKKEIAIPFKLWPKQIEALEQIVRNRLVIVLKARQLGLTWLVLVYSVWKMVTRAGYSIIALSKKEDPDAKELIRRVKFILRHLPKWLVLENSKAPDNYSGLTWEATALKIMVNHPMLEPSSFQSMSSAPDSGRSFTANLVFLDEWAFQEWAEQIWDGAYPLINRPTGGQVIGLSTGKRNTLFEKEWNRAVSGESNFTPVFLSWRTDPRRDEAWHVQTKLDMPNSYRNEYPLNPEDAFTVGEGAFFEEWDETTHVIDYWEPPKHWQIYGAYDPGFASNACFKWYAVSPDENAICFREYYPHRVTDEDQAKEIVRLSCYSDRTPFVFRSIAADTDAWIKSRSAGISTAEKFLDYRLILTQATKDLENGWRRLHQWLKPFKGHDEKPTALLRFTKNCKNTRRTYPSCESSKTNPEDIDRNNEHHPQDCFVAGTKVTMRGGYKNIEDVKIGDEVLTRFGYKKIVVCGEIGIRKVISVIFSNGKTLVGTPDHPIFTKDKGFIALDSIRYSDIIVTESEIKERSLKLFGVQTLAEKEIIEESQEVYNLTVEGCPEFFANGILVHNCDRYFTMDRPMPKKVIEEFKILTGMDVKIKPKERTTTAIMKAHIEKFKKGKQINNYVGTGNW